MKDSTTKRKDILTAKTNTSVTTPNDNIELSMSNHSSPLIL